MRACDPRSPRRVASAYRRCASLRSLERAAAVGIPIGAPRTAVAVARLLRRRSALASITEDEAGEITALLLEKEPAAFLAGLEQVECLRRCALAAPRQASPIC